MELGPPAKQESLLLGHAEFLAEYFRLNLKQTCSRNELLEQKKGLKVLYWTDSKGRAVGTGDRPTKILLRSFA